MSKTNKVPKSIGKYFGPDKIADIKLVDEKTYLGNPKVCLTFPDKTTKIIPQEMAEKCSTAQATDLTQLQDLLVAPMVEKMLALVVDSELTAEQVTYAINVRLKGSLDDSMEQAAKKLWGKESYELTFMDVEKVLRSKDESPSKKGKTRDN